MRSAPSRPLRVLFLNENIGGHATVHAALRRTTAERDDVEARFLDVPDPGLIGKALRRPVPGLAGHDLDLQPLRSQLVRSTWTRRALRRELAKGETDVLHVYTQNGALRSAAQLRSVPTVITTDSTNALNAYRLPYRSPTRYTPWSVRVVTPLERQVLTSARRVVANSDFIADSLRGHYGLSESVVTVLPFGIWLPPPPAERPDRRPTIVFVGQSLSRKGGQRLVRLHQQHLREQCDLLLVTGEPVEPLPGVRVMSDLTPGSDALWPLLASADIMCFPSEIDQAPNAVLEAAAAGLPVVALPVGAVPEMVRDGQTGLIVPLGDDQALLTALRRLIEDVPLRRRLGEAGRRHMEQHYDMRASTDRLIALLRDAVRIPVDR